MLNPILFIFFICLGMFFVMKGMLNCQTPKRIIEYRFVPRTFEEDWSVKCFG